MIAGSGRHMAFLPRNCRHTDSIWSAGVVRSSRPISLACVGTLPLHNRRRTASPCSSATQQRDNNARGCGTNCCASCATPAASHPPYQPSTSTGR